MREHFGKSYGDLLFELLGSPETLNTRTRTRVRTAYGARSFIVDLSKGLELPGNRAYYPKVAAAEVAWMLMGTKDPAFVMKHAPKLWGKFIEDGELAAAYGHRWRQAFGRDQISWMVSALRRDPSNRQCWVQAWDPRFDGLGYPDQPKNIPCPVGFTANIIDGKLHLALFIRSSDAYVGLPYDTMAYGMLASLIGRELGIPLGTLHITLANVHLYEPHWALAEDDFEHLWRPETLPFTGQSLSDVEFNPESFVTGWAQYKPSTELPRKLPELIE